WLEPVEAPAVTHVADLRLRLLGFRGRNARIYLLPGELGVVDADHPGFCLSIRLRRRAAGGGPALVDAAPIWKARDSSWMDRARCGAAGGATGLDPDRAGLRSYRGELAGHARCQPPARRVVQPGTVSRSRAGRPSRPPRCDVRPRPLRRRRS